MSDPTIRTQIQAAMREAFPDAESRVAAFYAMQEYQLGWRDEQLASAHFDPGKLLRPQMSLLACRAVGGDTQQALPLAAGIQLIHDFSLIHDDIEDQSATRRGRQTVWKLWGLAQGINTGDGMFVVAHLALHRLFAVGVPPATVLAILRRFDETVLTICEGQFLDLSYEGDLRITEANYLAMISRKTAVLVAAAAELGACVGGADETTTQLFFDFGQNLGLAFQIQDDLLGIWGNPAVTGKPAADDLRRRKLSLPIIYALNIAELHEPLAQVYRQPSVSDADVQEILRILDRAQARSYVEQTARRYHQVALAALDAIAAQPTGVPTAIATLRSMSEGLLNRTF